MTKTRAAKLRAKRGVRAVNPGVMVYSKQSRRVRSPMEVDYQLSPEFQYFGKKPRASRFIPIPPRNRGFSAQAITAPVSGSTIINRNAIQPFVTTLNNSTLVTNTELISDLSAIGVGNTRFAMIPAATAWVNGIAQNYSKWQVRYLRYIYIPTGPTSAAGSIIMSPGYDYFDLLPAAATALQRGFRSVTAPVWAGWEGAAALHVYGDKLPVGAVAIEIDVCEFKSGNELSKYPYISLPIFTLANGVTQNLYGPGYLDIWLTNPTAGNLFCQYQYEFFEPVDPTLNKDV